MKKRSIAGLSVVSFVILSLVLAGLFQQHDSRSSAISTSLSLNEDNSPSTDVLRTNKSSSRSTVEVDTGFLDEVNGSREAYDYADYLAAHHWISAKGYFLAEERLPYETLSDEALVNLIESSDILAMHVLSDRYLEKYHEIGSSHDESLYRKHKQLLLRAAVHGSTAAITRIGKSYASNSFFYGEDVDRRRSNIMALSFFEAALIRGDRQAEVEIHHLKRRLSEPFSKSELADAKQKGRELYIQLVALRDQIPGLDGFDNSIPDFVDRYYDDVMKSFEGS